MNWYSTTLTGALWIASNVPSHFKVRYTNRNFIQENVSVDIVLLSTGSHTLQQPTIRQAPLPATTRRHINRAILRPFNLFKTIGFLYVTSHRSRTTAFNCVFTSVLAQFESFSRYSKKSSLRKLWHSAVIVWYWMMSNIYNKNDGIFWVELPIQTSPSIKVVNNQSSEARRAQTELIDYLYRLSSYLHRFKFSLVGKGVSQKVEWIGCLQLCPRCWILVVASYSTNTGQSWWRATHILQRNWATGRHCRRF